MTRCSTGADAMIGDVAVEGCKAGCESGWLTWKGSDGDLGDDGEVWNERVKTCLYTSDIVHSSD